jgi:hypothetical protein
MTDTITRTLSDVLRSAADLIGAHPELPAPYITTSSYDDRHGADLNWYLMHDSSDLGEQKAAAQKIIRAIGGHWDKVPDTYSDFTFIQERDGLRLFMQVTREAVCERVVTGTETVTIPAKAAVPERTETREVVEWRCEPLLAEAVSA